MGRLVALHNGVPRRRSVSVALGVVELLSCSVARLQAATNERQTCSHMYAHDPSEHLAGIYNTRLEHYGALLKAMRSLTTAEQASLNKRQTAKLDKATANMEKASADLEELRRGIASAKSALEKLNESMKHAKETLQQKTADRNDLVAQLRGELGSKQKPGK